MNWITTYKLVVEQQGKERRGTESLHKKKVHKVTRQFHIPVGRVVCVGMATALTTEASRGLGW